MLFKNKYKELWEQQNNEIDMISVRHNNEIKRKNKEIDKLNGTINTLEQSIKKSDDFISTYKSEQKRIYSILEKKYTCAVEKLDKLKDEKKKLSSAKGGFIHKINDLTKELEKEKDVTKSLKQLIQKLVKESGRKLTPPTIQELKNYNLFGNRKGLKK